MEYDNNKKYVPGEVKYECPCERKELFWSRFSGEFRNCPCGAVAVDQTAYYTRCIGQKDDKFAREYEETHSEL